MAQAAVPEDLRYTKEHEWVRVTGNTAVVGITDHAQHALGDVTYVELPRVGKTVKQFTELAVVESAKAASDVYAPLSGTVTEVNGALDTRPEQLNAGPYGEGWLCKLKDINSAELDNLLTPAQYRELLKAESE